MAPEHCLTCIQFVFGRRELTELQECEWVRLRECFCPVVGDCDVDVSIFPTITSLIVDWAVKVPLQFLQKGSGRRRRRRSANRLVHDGYIAKRICAMRSNLHEYQSESMASTATLGTGRHGQCLEPWRPALAVVFCSHSVSVLKTSGKFHCLVSLPRFRGMLAAGSLAQSAALYWHSPA